MTTAASPLAADVACVVFDTAALVNPTEPGPDVVAWPRPGARRLVAALAARGVAVQRCRPATGRPRHGPTWRPPAAAGAPVGAPTGDLGRTLVVARRPDPDLPGELAGAAPAGVRRRAGAPGGPRRLAEEAASRPPPLCAGRWTSGPATPPATPPAPHQAAGLAGAAGGRRRPAGRHRRRVPAPAAAARRRWRCSPATTASTPRGCRPGRRRSPPRWWATCWPAVPPSTCWPARPGPRWRWSTWAWPRPPSSPTWGSPTPTCAAAPRT